MFIVANPSKREVVISDLNLVIPPHQSRDLHQLDLPIPPEKSKDLEFSRIKGYITIVKKDVVVSVGPVSQPPPSSPPQIVIHEKEILDKEHIAQTIREEIQKSLQNQKTEQSSNPQNNDILNEILKKLNNISSKNNNIDNISEDKQEGIDEETLKRIHAKAVDKMVKNVEVSSLEYEEKDVKDTSVSKNISELEGLI
jgi:hypothetical protein